MVYGGGGVGLMGALADAVIAEGGELTGVIPRSLVDREIAHRDVMDMRVVGSMHERKALMAELADAFVALPGGIGTLEELFEVYTWAQLGLHQKPCALLNVEGYYDGIEDFLTHAVRERFLREETRELLMVDSDAAALIERLRPSSRGGRAEVDRPRGDLAAGSPGTGPSRDHSSRRVLHTPRDPFTDDRPRVLRERCGCVRDGEIVATGTSQRSRAPGRGAARRGDAPAPGLVDTHVHWPQLGAVGPWASSCSTARTDAARGDQARRPRLRAPAARTSSTARRERTTTALVFGAHFPEAQEAFFEAAAGAA